MTGSSRTHGQVRKIELVHVIEYIFTFRLYFLSFQFFHKYFRAQKNARTTMIKNDFIHNISSILNSLVIYQYNLLFDLNPTNN